MLRDDWLPATFSKVVHRRREFLRISQEELSNRSGLHRTYISDVERGARNVSLKNMSKLAAALEISPSALIRWTEVRNLKELSSAVEPEVSAFFDSTGSGYLLLDTSGAVVNANSTQLAWLGRSMETLVGSRVTELIVEVDRNKILAALEAMQHEATVQRVQTHFVGAGGVPIAVSLDVVPIKDESDEYAMTRVCASRIQPSSQESGTTSQLSLYQSISEGGPVPVVGIGLDHNITFWNYAAQQMFGFSANEALGASISLIAPDEKINELHDILARAGKGFARQQIDVKYRTKGGTLISLSMTCSPVKSGTAVEGIACFFSPTQTEQQQRGDSLAVELGVVSALEEAPSFTEAIPQVLLALSGNRWDFAMLWWVDPDGGQLRPFHHLAAETVPPEAVHSLTMGIRFLNNGLPRMVWESRESFWIPDVATEPRCRPQVSSNQFGLHTGVWFPITVGREVIGVFELLSKQAVPLDQDALNSFNAIGTRIGRSILRSGERPRIVDGPTASTTNTKQARQ